MTLSVGQDIYVPNRFNVTGGLAEVSEITTDIGASNQQVSYIKVVEHPGYMYNWDQGLAHLQCRLKKRYHDRRAHPGIEPPEPED